MSRTSRRSPRLPPFESRWGPKGHPCFSVNVTVNVNMRLTRHTRKALDDSAGTGPMLPCFNVHMTIFNAAAMIYTAADRQRPPGPFRGTSTNSDSI